MSDHKTGTLYGHFNQPLFAGTGAAERAVLHCIAATDLLADTKPGIYHITPPNLTAAAVHAQLATAWAAIAANTRSDQHVEV